jgi:hypothetical protein
MPNPVNVEKDFFGHIAAAHLRGGNRIKVRSRTDKRDVIAECGDFNYRVSEIEIRDEGPNTLSSVPYDNAREAVVRTLDVIRLWKVPLGDVEFSDREGQVAVTWRHLCVRLKTLRWVLSDDNSVIAGILEEAKNL